MRCNINTKAARQTYHAYPVNDDIGKSILLTYDLQSPNTYTNKKHGDRIYQNIKRQWARLLGVDLKTRKAGTKWHAAMHFAGHGNSRRRVVIDRRVKDKTELYDKDNLYGSVKPLLDMLRYLKVIRDDTEQWVDLQVDQVADGVGGVVRLTVEDC